MVSLTMASPSDFSTSHTCLLLSSGLVSSLLFSSVFCDFVYQIKMMIDVSLRVLFIYLFLHLFIIFFINLGYGHWVDLLITFVFLSLGSSGSIQRLEISKKKKRKEKNFPLQYMIFSIAMKLRSHKILKFGLGGFHLSRDPSKIQDILGM